MSGFRGAGIQGRLARTPWSLSSELSQESLRFRI